MEPLPSVTPATTLATALLRLPPGARLPLDPPYCAYQFNHAQAPALMYELGRLRETTFRAAGEGTGKALDLDPFDQIYTQYLLWHLEKREIVGAFRMTNCAEALAKHGRQGLYTAAFYHYPPDFFERMAPCWEVGRMFLQPAYQNFPQLALTLWRVIGQAAFSAKESRYLIGAVSLSRRLSDRAWAEIVAFLQTRRASAEFSNIESVRPFRPVIEIETPAETVQQLQERLTQTGWGADRLPASLKLFLALGARPLGFCYDPHFGHCLDALMYIDLTETPQKYLQRMMGATEADIFRRKNLSA